MQYHIVFNGQRVGPVSKEQLLNYGLTAESLVWTEGMGDWQKAYTVPELAELIARAEATTMGAGQPRPAAPMPQPGMPYGQPMPQQGMSYGQPMPHPGMPYGPSGKSKTTAGILAILLGILGIHYFYIGKPVGGCVFLGAFILTCGILAPIVSILALVQGIMMLCKTEQEFDEKYVYTTSSFPLF